MFGSMFGFGAQAPYGSTVTHTSFAERMGNAICGVFVGIALFIAGAGIIGWNEGNYVYTECAISEAERLVVENTNCVFNPADAGTLIHVSCDVNKTRSVVPFAYEPLNVKTVGLVFENAMQAYVIEERESCTTTKDKVGGGTTKKCDYSYGTGWSSTPPNAFRGPNPTGYNPSFPSGFQTELSGYEKTAPTLYMGTGFEITNPAMIRAAASGRVRVGPATPLPPFVNAMTYNPNTRSGNSVSSVQKTNTSCNFQYSNSQFDTGGSRVGDVKVIFEVSQPANEFSVVGKATASGGFEKFVFEKCNSYSFLGYNEGKKTAADLFAMARDANSLMTWILRFVCFLMLWCGCQLCWGPVALAPDIIPCIGPFIGDLVGCLLMCATCLLATFWFCIIFAISWVYFRPMIGIPMLIIGILSGVGLVVWRVKAKNDKEAAIAAAGGANTYTAPGAATPAPAAYGAPNDGGYPAPDTGGGYPAPGASAPSAPAAYGYPAPNAGSAYPAPGGAYPAPGGAYPAPGAAYPAPTANPVQNPY